MSFADPLHLGAPIPTGGLDPAPLCMTCKVEPRIDGDETCVACAVEFYLDNPDEFDDAVDRDWLRGADNQAVIRQVSAERLRRLAAGRSVYPTREQVLAHYQEFAAQARKGA